VTDGRRTGRPSRADETPHVEIDGVRLEYVEEGSGTAVVFSHGSGSDRRYWEPQRGPFGRHHRFIAYTRRFYGPGSATSDGDNALQAHAADLIGLIDRLAGGPAHVVGFSAPVALRAVIERPDLTRTLTIVEPNIPSLLAGDAEGDSLLAWWRGANDRVRDEAGDDAVRRAELWFELVNNRGPGAFADQPEAFRRMWIENMTAIRPTPTAAPELSCDELGTIGVPTLAIATEHGMPYSQRIVERLVACVPGARLVVIQSATHFVTYQDPDVFNPLVLGFLADVEPHSSS
jgi:pimeloyl-ACP methyl ester carboxylesterase